MRLAIFAGVVAVSLAASGTALAADPSPTGVEVGLRLGYSIPLGKASGDQTVGGQTVPGVNLSDIASSRIPIWIDAGYRFNPNMYVGAFLQYGFVSLASNYGGGACQQNGVSCSAHDIQFGAMFAYHLMPDQTIDPWGGVGIGYETLSGSATVNGQDAGGGSYKGLQFLNLQLGADYKVMPNLGVGPFLSFSLGSYSSATATANGQSQDVQNFQSGLHEWLTLGVRGAYDIIL